jgi:hypothetical protein
MDGGCRTPDADRGAFFAALKRSCDHQSVTLAQDVKAGEAEVLGGFWWSMEGRYPLVESTPGDKGRRWATLFWRDRPDVPGTSVSGVSPRPRTTRL